MSYIHLVVEGVTEERFYREELNAYYTRETSRRHYIETRTIPTHRKATQRSQKGGRIPFDRCVKTMRRIMQQSPHVDQVILLLDYYGIDKSFRIQNDGPSNLKEEVATIQNRLEKEVDHSRFRFILQVHEFEALLFSDPETIVAHFQSPNHLSEIKALLHRNAGDPERINNDVRTAPSKRLQKIFPGFGKTLDSVTIAQKIGIEQIRRSCYQIDLLCKTIEATEDIIHKGR